MKCRINVAENLFISVAIATIVAGFASVGSIGANVEYDVSSHEAAKDECIQLEGRANSLSREKEALGCYNTGDPHECRSLWEKMEVYSREEEECYRNLNSIRESGSSDCDQVGNVLQNIELEKRALECFSGENPTECDDLSQKFEGYAREAEVCHTNVQYNKDGQEEECRQMGEVRMSLEREIQSMGCYDKSVPDECEFFRVEEDELQQEVSRCWERIESSTGGGGGSYPIEDDPRIYYPPIDEPYEKPYCEPYVCADGSRHPRCSDNGSPINYFVNPCEQFEDKPHFPPPLPPWEDRPHIEPINIYPPEPVQAYPTSGTSTSQDCSYIKRNLEDSERKAREVCSSGNDVECRERKMRVEKILVDLERCAEGPMIYPQQPSPPWQDNDHSMPIPYPPEPVQAYPMSGTSTSQDCGYMKGELGDAERKAREVCYSDPNGGECQDRMSFLQEILAKFDECMGGPFSDNGRDGSMIYPQQSPTSQQDYPRAEPQVVQHRFEDQRRDDHLDENVERKFYDIMGQAHARLRESLNFVDGDMAVVIKETITWIEDLKRKFGDNDVRPTHEDIEMLVERLEKVKEMVDKNDRDRYDDGRYRDEYEDVQEQFDDRRNETGPVNRPPKPRPPKREVDSITEELSMIFEKMLPCVFEIFEEEGVSIPSSAREAYNEAYSAFKSVLPVCQGGEVARRVCAAAMQEVFMILEEDMRPFVEDPMRNNPRLAERIEELFESME